MLVYAPSGYGGYAPSPGFPSGGFGYGYGYAPPPPPWPMNFGYAPQQYGAASTVWSAPPLERPPSDAVFEEEATAGGRRLDEHGGGPPVCLGPTVVPTNPRRWAAVLRILRRS